jgi:hypothetical protein
MALRILRGLLSRIPLVHRRHFVRVAGDLLPCCSQGAAWAPLLLVSRCDMEGQPISQAIHGHLPFGAPTACGPVLASLCAAFRRRLEGAPIAEHRRRRCGTSRRQPPPRTQGRDDRFKHPRIEPALALLGDRVPRWQGMSMTGYYRDPVPAPVPFWLKPLSILGLVLITTFIESSHMLTIPSIQPRLRLMLADTPSPHGSGASRVTVGTVSAGSVRGVTFTG